MDCGHEHQNRRWCLSSKTYHSPNRQPGRDYALRLLTKAQQVRMTINKAPVGATHMSLARIGVNKRCMVLPFSSRRQFICRQGVDYN